MASDWPRLTIAHVRSSCYNVILTTIGEQQRSHTSSALNAAAMQRGATFHCW